MVSYILTFLLINFLWICVSTEALPGVTLCNPIDNECLKTAIQKVISLTPKDKPIEVEHWTAPAGKRYLKDKQIFSNIKLYNHNENKVNNVKSEITETKHVYEIDLFNPEILALANFEYNATDFLGSPFHKKAKTAFTLNNFTLNVRMEGDIIQKGDKKYMTLIDSKGKLTISKLSCKFETDDSEFDKKINKAFKDNWGKLFDDISSYGAFYANVYKDVANSNIFNQFSYDELYLN